MRTRALTQGDRQGGRRAVWLPLLWDLADIFDVEPGHFVAVADAAIARFEAGGRRAMRGAAVR